MKITIYFNIYLYHFQMTPIKIIPDLQYNIMNIDGYLQQLNFHWDPPIKTWPFPKSSAITYGPPGNKGPSFPPLWPSFFIELRHQHWHLCCYVWHHIATCGGPIHCQCDFKLCHVAPFAAPTSLELFVSKSSSSILILLGTLVRSALSFDIWTRCLSTNRCSSSSNLLIMLQVCLISQSWHRRMYVCA